MSYKVTEIADGVYQIRECKYGFDALMYLVVGEERAALIDTGFGIGDLRRRVEAITGLPVIVVVTHGHFDHIGANWQFADYYMDPNDRAVYLRHSDAEYLSWLIRSNLPPVLTFLLKPTLKKVTAVRPNENAVFHDLHGGDFVDLGGRSLEVLSTPGHTPGSICLLDSAARILFGGDTLVGRGVLLNLDFSEPPAVFLESMRRLKTRQKDFDAVWAGHHENPVAVSVLDDYIACAEGIARNTLPAESYETLPREQINARYGQIKIAINHHCEQGD